LISWIWLIFGLNACFAEVWNGLKWDGISLLRDAAEAGVEVHCLGVLPKSDGRSIEVVREPEQ
jgi:hypothetical protein